MAKCGDLLFQPIWKTIESRCERTFWEKLEIVPAMLGNDDPFGVLGLHQIGQVWAVRSLRPDAKELAIVDRHHVEGCFPATRLADEGLFEAQLEGVTKAFDYLLQVTTWSGETFQISDPYSYGQILGELDTYLYCMGNH